MTFTAATRQAGSRVLGAALWTLLLASGAPAAAENDIGRLTSEGNGSMRRHYEYDAQGRVRREVHVLDRTPFVYTNTFGYPAGSAAGPGTVPVTFTFPGLYSIP